PSSFTASPPSPCSCLVRAASPVPMGTKSLNTAACAVAAILLAATAILVAAVPASAGGWSTVHRYVKRSGACQEILASYYSSGKRTATGEAFDANGNTAAARTWPLGTSLTVTNPKNGRSLTVRINDRGPYGTAFAQGARLDLAHGAARRLGMSGAQYLCVSEGGSGLTVSAAPGHDGDAVHRVEDERLVRNEARAAEHLLRRQRRHARKHGAATLEADARAAGQEERVVAAQK